MYRRILVPFDGSAGSWNALRKAVQLAKGMNAEIATLSVIEPLPHYEETIEQVQAEHKEEAGQAAKTIIRRAQEENVDLIIIGHSGYSGVWGLLLGSTTARVVDHAQCDVLVVR